MGGWLRGRPLRKLYRRIGTPSAVTTRKRLGLFLQAPPPVRTDLTGSQDRSELRWPTR